MRFINRLVYVIVCVVTFNAFGDRADIRTENVSVLRTDEYINVGVDFILDSLHLKPNEQIYITPIIQGANEYDRVGLPSLLVNGRNMQAAYERGSLKGFRSIESHDIWKAVKRDNGKAQKVPYINRIEKKDWMLLSSSHVTFIYDSCSCGVMGAPTFGDEVPVFENPAPSMDVAFVVPTITELPTRTYHGTARVQFEVDKIVLHDSVYICKSGQRIDNRAELKSINDTIRKALTDPNVEIAEISVCGYASPESPYIHNDYLATGRSRALAEYLADRYSLPKERAKYSAVPENWAEFRQQVMKSDEITEQQRADLLELIDRPAYGPSDYDAKENELKTSPKFASLYKNLIHPKWFPKYRATTFAITTRLKPLSDEELVEVLATTPEKMSLNQMFRVANLYPVGSPEFNEAIQTALAYFPNSEEANLNAAASLIAQGRYDEALPFLDKAGNRPEVDNLRGIIYTSQGKYRDARDEFQKADELPEASRNTQLLQ